MASKTNLPRFQRASVNEADAGSHAGTWASAKLPIYWPTSAPVAQLDRVAASEAVGRGFESLRARQVCLVLDPMGTSCPFVGNGHGRFSNAGKREIRSAGLIPFPQLTLCLWPRSSRSGSIPFALRRERTVSPETGPISRQCTGLGGIHVIAVSSGAYRWPELAETGGYLATHQASQERALQMQRPFLLNTSSRRIRCRCKPPHIPCRSTHSGKSAVPTPSMRCSSHTCHR